MDYEQDIKALQEELKGLNVGHIGKVAGDKRDKTEEDKRKIVLLGAYQELQRIKNISEDLNRAVEEEADEPREREQHEEYREPLSIDKEEVYNISLSWGGGADGFKLTFKDGELLKGVYYMADWGEYKEVDLNQEEAEEVYNFYMHGDVTAFK